MIKRITNFTRKENQILNWNIDTPIIIKREDIEKDSFIKNIK